MDMSMKLKVTAFVAAGVLACTIFPITSAFASSDVEGGWSEETGYFTAESASEDNGIVAYSTPKHTGKSEQRSINGTTNKRAHGWTTWVGVRHYTTAQIEHTWPESGVIKTSGRVYGTDGTEAISPWNPFRPNVDWGIAKTYYGRG